MMYRLDWSVQAYLEMVRIHEAGDALVRHEIAVAIDTLTDLLRSTPRSAGEGREGLDRVLIVYPFRFMLTVDEDAKTVTILTVWQYRGR